MRSFKKLSLVAAALMASTAMVQAADLIQQAPTHDLPPEVVPSAAATGWYIRGDIGYSALDYDADTRFLQGGTFGGVIDDGDIDETFYLQGGIGYQVTDYFRVDATLGYHNDTDTFGFSRNIASVPAPGLVACINAPAGGTPECLFTDEQEFDATVLLANAYVDLGTVNGITPYVGAGIGGAHVSYGNLSNTQTCSVAAPTDPSCVDLTDIHQGEDQWRFAYAFHAGASFDINCRLKADAGYTFTRIEGGEAFEFPDGSGLLGTQGFDQGIDIHTGRVGLRYALSDAGCHSAPQPQVVYK